MNKVVLENNTFKFKIPILILTVVALVSEFINSIEQFVFFNSDDGYHFYFPGILNIISILLSISPLVLFLLFVIKFHKDFIGKFFIVGVFAIPIFNIGLSTINTFFNYKDIADLGEIARMIAGDFVRSLIFTIIPCMLMIIWALFGFGKKILPLVYVGIIVTASIGYFRPSFYSNIIDSRYLFVFFNFMSFFSSFAFPIALLLFVLGNKFVPIINFTKKEKRIEDLTPEKALNLLNEKKELGVISEEEYQAKRIEIIEKL